MHANYLTALLPLLSLTSALPSSKTSNKPLTNHTLPDLSATVYTTLATLGTELLSLNKTLNTLPTTSNSTTHKATIPLLTLLTLQLQAATVSAHVTEAALAANSSAVFTSAESANITAISTGIEQNVSSILANLLAHETLFKNEGLTALLEVELKVQREIVREEGNAVQAKLASGYSTVGANETAAVLADFDAAIAAFAPATTAKHS